MTLISARDPSLAQLSYKNREKFRAYKPFADFTGLFRTFAGLDLTPESVLAFTNRYGLLGESYTPEEPTTISMKTPENWPGNSKPAFVSGISVPAFRRMPENVSGPSEPTIWPRPYEPLEVWFHHIKLMKRSVEIWDAVQSDDRRWLRKHIRWPGLQACVEISMHSYNATIASYKLHLHLLPIINEDSRKAAAVFLQTNVNEQLKGRTGPALLFNDDDALELFNRPNTLIGAMWLQFALAISGNREYAECAWCGTQFDVSAYRKGKKTCSDSCRNLLSRSKNKKRK